MSNYRIPIGELLERPIIRTDQVSEFLNKMTDKEIDEFYEDIDTIISNENKTKRRFPDWNAARLAKLIDRDILYNLFKFGDEVSG